MVILVSVTVMYSLGTLMVHTVLDEHIGLCILAGDSFRKAFLTTKLTSQNVCGQIRLFFHIRHD